MSESKTVRIECRYDDNDEDEKVYARSSSFKSFRMKHNY